MRTGTILQRSWKRLDQPGLELAQVETRSGEIRVTSTLIDTGRLPIALRYQWTLSPDWTTRRLVIESSNNPERTLLIERTGESYWRVDGQDAPHLNGCVELDLSATPFCNSLAIRRLGETGEMLAAYIAAPQLTVTPSLQRYEKLGARTWCYIDLGVVRGFEAELRIDEQGFVTHYEGLFEALDQGAGQSRPRTPDESPFGRAV